MNIDNLTKEEKKLLRACILVHIEFSTSAKTDKSYEMDNKLVNLANKLNITTGYEDFFNK